MNTSIEFKLSWIDSQGRDNYNWFSNMHAALEQAGKVYREGGTLISLMNSLGDHACPPDQLELVAIMRAEVQQKKADTKTMEANPEWGSM